MFKSLNKGLLLAGTSSVLALALFASAQNSFSQTANFNPIQSNLEVQSPFVSPGVTDGLPFQITVDGVAIDGSTATASDDQRTLDVALDRMDVQVTFDGLKIDKALSLSANKSAFASGEIVKMRGYWNYGAFIENAEVRVFSTATSTKGTPLATLDLGRDRTLSWTYPANMPGEVQVVLRVYDERGNFDETAPKRFTTLSEPANTTLSINDGDVDAFSGYGENSLETNGIIVSGGTVTVFGTDVPSNNSVFVLGNPVPVDGTGRFVASEVMPSGDHNVTIAVLDGAGRGLEFQRNLYIPGSDLFYVGVGDFTVGTGATTGPTELVGENSEWGQVSTQGRVAAFARGKIADNIFLTAQADTGEAPLDEIFVNFLDRDPRKVSDRIGTFDTYNSFGDGSSIERVADSQGKFYVKAEQGQNYALWGNYKTNINGPVYAAFNRSLYGASLSYRSDGLQTDKGNPAIELDAFYAQQGTTGHRDVLRGTGGSIYFLSYQDIQPRGERVSIEIRDGFSGEVKKRKELSAGVDYDIDSLQGRIILNEVLPSSAGAGWLVDTGLADAGDKIFLVVDYEYTPKNFDQFKDPYYGARAVGRIGDWVSVGGTYLRDENSATGRDRQLLGGDVAFSLGGQSYVRAEIARTDGDPTAEFGSSDGGYTVGDNNTDDSGGTNRGIDGAMAYRVDALVDTSDLTDAFSAKASGYYEHKDKGVAVANGFAAEDTDAFGVEVNVPIADIVTLSGRYDNKKTTPTAGAATITQRVNVDAVANFDRITTGLGIGYSDTDGKDLTNIGGNVSYKFSDQVTVGAKASTTVQSADASRDKTNFGLSASTQLTDQLSITTSAGYSFKNTDVSDASLNASISSDYILDDKTALSLGYSITDPEAALLGSETLSGDLNFGFKRKVADNLSFYIEERLAHKGETVGGLTHMFGVDFAPDEAWQASANAEVGRVDDLDRQAASVNGGYRGNGFNVGAALEYRREETDNKNDSIANDVRQTYVAKADASVDISDDWTARANGNLVLSEQNGSFIDGNFVEGSIGAAYRPVDNNTLQGLFRYTFLYDLPTNVAGGTSADGSSTIGSAIGYKQRSHILEADGIWQINDNFSLGAKYGVRFGEVTASRDSETFFGDTIHLGVARVDWHVVRNWDAMLEGRVMYQQDTGAVRYGAVAAVYRHFGDNFKVGVGYNFGSFNDDLTNVSFDSQGVFLNAIAKF